MPLIRVLIRVLKSAECCALFKSTRSAGGMDRQKCDAEQPTTSQVDVAFDPFVHWGRAGSEGRRSAAMAAHRRTSRLLEWPACSDPESNRQMPYRSTETRMARAEPVKGPGHNGWSPKSGLPNLS